MKKEHILLFDLGGVLIDLNWLEKAVKLFNANEGLEELKKRWLNLKSAREYESGRVNFDEFYAMFIEETGSKIDFVSFKREFSGIIGPVKPGCMEMLNEFNKAFPIAMLSNTNAFHVELLREQTEIFSPFPHLFFSYQLKMVKPDHEIFYAVCSRLKCKPSQIVFFDDSMDNVAAARSCGMGAYRVDGPAEIRAIVQQL